MPSKIYYIFAVILAFGMLWICTHPAAPPPPPSNPPPPPSKPDKRKRPHRQPVIGEEAAGEEIELDDPYLEAMLGGCLRESIRNEINAEREKERSLLASRVQGLVTAAQVAYVAGAKDAAQVTGLVLIVFYLITRKQNE